jgi:pimeloyl-ACP methyl ester carboxylesterase
MRGVIVRWILASVLFLVALVVLARVLARVVVARRTRPRGLHERRFEVLGGVEQWVELRGDDPAAPPLLYLHAHGISSLFATLLRPWERRFVVVHWDRRTVGRTRRRNGDAGSEAWTFDLLASDGIELAERLVERFGRPLLLVAHSQGTVVGAKMAAARPDLFSEYVGIGQLGDMERNELLSHAALCDAARRTGNEKALGRLEASPPPYRELGAWLRKQQPAGALDPELKRWQRRAVRTILTVPGMSLRQALRSAMDVVFLPPLLFTETMACTPAWLGTRLDVPVTFVHGAEDVHAMPEVAAAYLELVEAPAKQLVTVDGAGHMLPLLEPERVLDVLPAATA